MISESLKLTFNLLTV